MTLKRPCPSGSASLSSWTDLHSLEQALFDRLCFIYMCVSICYFRPRWARRRGSPWPWRAEAPLHGSAWLLSAVLSGGAEALGAQASGAAAGRLSGCGLLRGTWNLPRPGTEPVPPAPCPLHRATRQVLKRKQRTPLAVTQAIPQGSAVAPTPLPHRPEPPPPAASSHTLPVSCHA